MSYIESTSGRIALMASRRVELIDSRASALHGAIA